MEKYALIINENTKDGLKSLEEVSTQTDKMRLTAEIGRFLQESMQMLKSANICVYDYFNIVLVIQY